MLFVNELYLEGKRGGAILSDTDEKELWENFGVASFSKYKLMYNLVQFYLHC